MTERLHMTSGEPARGLLLTDKHIVFAVMAASAVAVIVFLCGVFVGRGVLSAQPAGDGVGQDGRLLAADGPGPAGEGHDDTGGGGEETGIGVPPQPSQGIDYPERLTGKATRDEALRAQEQTLALPGPPPEVPAESPSSAPPARTGSAAVSGSAPPPPAKVKEDPGKGPYTVQVASFRQKQKADAQRIVDNLKRHGFPAYLFAPASGSNEGFRVRVGTYKSRQEADVMAARLQKEKYKTWITRLPS